MENNTSFPQDLVVSKENARFMTRVYGWMSGGIALTALISYFASETPGFMDLIITNKTVFYGLMISQFVCVLSFSFLIQRINSFAAAILYFLYSALTGLTFSVLFMIYTQTSIAQVFILTSASFAGLSAYGFITKRDLGPLGAFCMMGLFGMLGYALISWIFPSLYSERGGMIYSAIGVLVFSGLTAYDTQKIKKMNVIGNEGTDADRKLAIHGALILYLDFINLFLSLLRLMGGRRK